MKAWGWLALTLAWALGLGSLAAAEEWPLVAEAEEAYAFYAVGDVEPLEGFARVQDEDMMGSLLSHWFAQDAGPVAFYSVTVTDVVAQMIAQVARENFVMYYSDVLVGPVTEARMAGGPVWYFTEAPAEGGGSLYLYAPAPLDTTLLLTVIAEDRTGDPADLEALLLDAAEAVLGTVTFSQATDGAVPEAEIQALWKAGRLLVRKPLPQAEPVIGTVGMLDGFERVERGEPEEAHWYGFVALDGEGREARYSVWAGMGNAEACAREMWELMADAKWQMEPLWTLPFDGRDAYGFVTRLHAYKGVDGATLRVLVPVGEEALIGIEVSEHYPSGKAAPTEQALLTAAEAVWGTVTLAEAWR